MTDSGHHDLSEGQEKSQRVQQLVFDLARRRSAGEDVSDEALIQARPDLMPELEEELRRLRLVEAARVKAAEAAPAAPTRPDSDGAAEEAEQQQEQNKDAAQPRSRGLHVRCPHCHNPIEVVVDTPLTDVTCRACGSRFSLVESGIETRSAAKVRTIGHFDLIEQLGRGSFGTVWKAYDRELQRTVAVKIPRQGQIGPAEAESFLEEARNAARVSHPNIVAVHEVGRDGEDVYIVSDIVRGVKLSDWLSARQPAPREAAKLCAKIARALHCAHEAGVVHRDLKPQNIMIDPDGDPHLMDFGLAKREAGEITMTVEGKILGTAAYIPPEQARGESHKADRRADIYSMGVILFELLTGERPFRGTEPMLIHQAVYDEAPTPRKLNSSVPKDLETICLKCLRKEPKARYQTAAELADELGRFLNGQPIQARPLGRMARGWRWCRRNPVPSALSAAVILTLLGGIAVSSYFAAGAYSSAAAARRDKGIADKSRIQADKALHNAQEQRQAAELSLYRARILLARQHWEDGLVQQARELLDPYTPTGEGGNDYLGWEWHYLQSLCHQEQMTLRGHVGPVWSVAWCPDGQRIVSAGDDQTLRVWDPSNGRLICVLGGHTAPIRFVAWHPHKRVLASAGDDQTLRIWDADREKLVCVLSGHVGTVRCLAWSPDGVRIASGGADRTVRIWDVSTGKEVETLGPLETQVRSLAWSPDGKRIAAGYGSWDKEADVVIWKTSTWEKEGPWNVSIDRPIVAIDWSPNSDALAASTEFAELCIFYPEEAKGMALPRDTGNILSVAWRPGHDMQVASAGESQTVRIYDGLTQQVLAALCGHTDTVTSVDWSPDGKRLASSSEDGTIRLWDLAKSGETARQWVFPNFVNSVSWEPDGERLAVSYFSTTPRILETFGTGDGLALTGQAKQTRWIAWSPDGQKVAVVGWERTARVWDSAGRELCSLPHIGDLLSCAWSPDSNRLVTAGEREIVVWDTSAAEKIRVLAEDRCEAVAWAPSDLIASARMKGKRAVVEIWDPAREIPARAFDAGMSNVSCLAWGPCGTLLVAGCADGTVQAWNVDKGQQLYSVRGHDKRVTSIAWSPDASRLATSSWEGTIKIRDPRTGDQVLMIRNETGPVLSVAWSPDGRRLAVGTQGRKANFLRILDASASYALYDNSATAEEITCRGGPVTSLFERVNRIRMSDSEDRIRILRDVEAYLTEKAREACLGHEDFNLALSTAYAFEYIGDPDLSRRAYLTFANLLSPLGEPSSADHVSVLDAIARRFELPGKKMELSGTTNDGTPFDWESYRGRVVLVVFWSTVDAATIDRIARARAAYNLYKESGFDVVGVRVNDKADAQSRVLERDGCPWVTVHGPIVEPRFALPNLPAAFLVDTQGKVISTDIDDAALDQMLERMLGPTERIRRVYGATSPFLKHGTGECRDDAWLAIPGKHSPGHMVFGPYAMSLPPRGHHTASFRLKVQSVQHSQRLLILEVHDRDTDSTITRRELFARDFAAPGEYKEFSLGFYLAAPKRLEFRVWWDGRNEVSFDRVVVTSARHLCTDWDVRFYTWSGGYEDGIPKDWDNAVSQEPIAHSSAQSLDFHCETEAPHPNVPADYFALVATTSEYLAGGEYLVRTLSDEGIRVYVDGDLIIDNFIHHGMEDDFAVIELAKGNHEIRVEHYDAEKGAALHFVMNRASWLDQALVKRCALFGQPVELAGKTLDGEELDWQSYRGKVVLIAFFAASSPGCRSELTQTQKFYQIYADRGLDVVGVSLDRDRDALEAFLREEQLPWVTLHDSDMEGSHPLADSWGVTNVPTTFLVNEEGKVVSLEAQGPKLPQLLRKHLGPADAVCEQYAASGNWSRAVPIYRGLVELEPDNAGRHRDLAVVQLQAGDLLGYRATCRNAFKRFRRENVWAQAFLAQVCTLTSESGVDREEIARAAAKAREQVHDAFFRLAKGMAEYRCGRFEAAIEELPKAGDSLQVPLSLLFQAMAHQQLGHAEEARGLFRQACDEIRRRVPTPEGPPLADYLPSRWIVWCMLDIVRREAAGMIPDPGWHQVQRAEDLIEAGKLSEAVKELSKVIETEPDYPRVLLRRGSLRARLGQWKGAAEDFVKGLKLGTPEDLDWLRAAPLLVLAEDSVGYREQCTSMLAKAKDLDNLPATERVIKACLLVPDQVPITDLPLAQLEQALDDGSAPAWFLGWGYTTRALAAYRKGEPEAALRWIAEAETTVAHAENANLRALALAVKALAQHRLDHHDEARQSLDEAARMIDEELPKLATGTFTGGWHDWLIAEVIRREAGRLVKAQPQKSEQDARL